GPAGATTGPGGGTITSGTTTITTAVVADPAAGEETGVILIDAANGIGNINVAGNVGTIHAAILGPVTVSRFNAPVAVGLIGISQIFTPTIIPPAAPPVAPGDGGTGSINQVILRAGGIAPSGSGAISTAGIYADDQIGPITNDAPADIRGSIISKIGLTGINLREGSIIHATIGTLEQFNQSTEIPVPGVIQDFQTPITNPAFNVGNIVVNGNGGIIGTQFDGVHYGRIAVHGGFGILDTFFGTLGDGTIAGIITDGYGLRKDIWSGGSSIGTIAATGNGSNVSTHTYSADVRLSETQNWDPYFGLNPNLLTDINVTTGATAANPFLPGFDGGGTDTGVIQDSVFAGNRDLGSLRAYQIRATNPALLPTFINFANSIGTVTTLSNNDGLSITTGRFKLFQPGGDSNNTQVIVAGPIKKLALKGNLLGTSSIQAVGVNGNIGTLLVGGSISGKITATRKIGNVTIMGSLGGTVSAASVGSLKVNGILNGGNLDIQGNISLFQTAGDLGLPGETLTIHGSAQTIKIGGSVNANVIVQGNVGNFFVGHSIISGNNVTVTGVLNNIVVNGDLQTGAIVTAALIKKKVIHGAIQGTI
ncbi:MAG TPA: hypothetical protein VFC78_19710, partial [Tepidisphaeraceae bacterium]|nr:hypothetical protein [Tepidisphaeraceae bacterium]